MPESPISSLSRLMHRLNDVAKENGLRLVGFSVIPNYIDDGPHTAQAVLHLDPDFGKKEKEADPDFDALAAAFRKQEQDERAAAARADLQNLSDSLADPKDGLGLD